MNRSIVLVPAVLMVGVLGAACSSSSSTGSPSSTPPSSSSSSSSSTPPASTSSSPPSSGQSSSQPSSSGSVPSTAALKSIVVRQSDLPSGWTGRPSPAQTSKNKEIDAELDTCVGASVAGDKDQVQQVRSDDFSKGQATVSSDASSYKTENDVSQQVAALKSPKAQSCLSSLFGKELRSSVPAAAKLSGVVIKLDTTHNGGISNLAGFADGSLTITAQGRSVKVYIGAAFFTGRQITGNVTFTSIGSPLASSFANPIVEAVAKRAANA